MKPEDQTKALAELDGMEDFDMLKKQTGDLTRYLHGANRKENRWRLVPNYLISYDAIIPLCRKVRPDIIWAINLTPSELCEALLRATGRWIES